MDLKPLLIILKVVSMLGLVTACGMVSAVIYKRMKDYYPEEVKKYRWVFILFAAVLSMIFLFSFQKFLVPART